MRTHEPSHSQFFRITDRHEGMSRGQWQSGQPVLPRASSKQSGAGDESLVIKIKSHALNIFKSLINIWVITWLHVVLKRKNEHSKCNSACTSTIFCLSIYRLPRSFLHTSLQSDGFYAGNQDACYTYAWSSGETTGYLSLFLTLSLSL